MMPSSAAAAAAAAAEDHHHLFGGEVEEDDVDSVGEDEGESLEEEDEEEGEELEQKPLPRPAVTVPGGDLIASSSNGHAPNLSTNPNPNPAKSSPPASPSQNGVIRVSPIASVAPAATADDDFTTPSPDSKRQKTDTASDERKPAAPLEDSRRLFQRLWTDEDEIVILQGYLEFTSLRNSTNNYLQDTGPFYDQIKNRLELDFNKNQLVEKLRRLKKKYKNIMNKMGSGKEIAFKSSHDQAIFEISRRIWRSCTSRSHDPDEDDPNPLCNTADANTSDDQALNSDRRDMKSRRRVRKRSSAASTAAAAAEGNTVVKASASIPNVVEETVKSYLSPLLKELLYCAVGGPVGQGLGGGGVIGLALSPLQFNCGVSPVNLASSGPAMDEKWRKQQIMELEVYLKRIELVQDQIKSTLEELRSLGG